MRRESVRAVCAQGSAERRWPYSREALITRRRMYQNITAGTVPSGLGNATC